VKPVSKNSGSGTDLLVVFYAICIPGGLCASVATDSILPLAACWLAALVVTKLFNQLGL
jgi:hypothetical protein